MPKRILIVEDETVVRRAIRAFLEHHRFEICGEAVNGVEAIEKAAALHPDLITLDLSMPLMNGIEAASLLKTKAPGIPVVIYTMLEDILGKSLATTLGVRGVVSKADGLAKLLACIEGILESGTSITPHPRPHIDH
jgi:DNA-binding NarL/FixJ family response regulator